MTGPETADSPDRSSSNAGLRVVNAVAEADGIDPVDVEPPLYETLDTAALDRLFGSVPPTTCGQVSFSYRGYDVTVHTDDRVELE